MSHPQLDNLVRIGQLKRGAASPDELRGLLNLGLARLRDANRPDLALESRFDLAYNAAYSLALTALRHAGYRSDSRHLVFQSLVHTVELPDELWRVLDQAHRMRNLAEYEGHLDVEEELIAAILRTAQEVARRLQAGRGESGRS